MKFPGHETRAGSGGARADMRKDKDTLERQKEKAKRKEGKGEGKGKGKGKKKRMGKGKEKGNGKRVLVAGASCLQESSAGSPTGADWHSWGIPRRAPAFSE
ncbi:MAG: hypothetical protein D6679_14580 [Candidatus Hydrogenedentota bacterium]|nr:MAG: hypothetical protein D6679_14580 [Candidatus Hydrogenedentota bacterium]